ANQDCQKVLRPLQNPTLVEMVEACNRISTIEHKYTAMAAAFAALKVSPGGTAANSPVCYGCGKPGHLKRDCIAHQG
ncbi:GAK5 protein, partial [Pomatostomus ruficeps]|nr:GAK5 protein [Pomatostomus ruficeps]